MGGGINLCNKHLINETIPKSNRSDKQLLILTSSFPKSDGDHSGNFILKLAESLRGNAIPITVLAPHQPGFNFNNKISDINIKYFPYFFPLRYQSLATEGGIPYNIRRNFLAKIQIPTFIVAQLIWAIKLIRKEKVCIINSHWLIPQGLIGATCKSIFNISHIATVHSSEITLLKKFFIGNYLARFIVKNSDTVISVSQHRANTLLSLLPKKTQEDAIKKIKIIPMGISVDQSAITEDLRAVRMDLAIDSKYVILFVGRLVEVKGCEYLIDSMQLVVETNKDVLLLLVGGGPLEKELKQRVNDKKLNKYIRFEGFVENAKLKDYYAIADIVVVPSIVDSSGFEEGLPVVLLEAMAFGKPIIGTKTNGVLEAIRDGWNGLIVEPKNSDQLAMGILKMVHDPDLMTKFSNNAQISAKEYDWNVIAERYSDVINELCPTIFNKGCE